MTFKVVLKKGQKTHVVCVGKGRTVFLSFAINVNTNTQVGDVDPPQPHVTVIKICNNKSFIYL